MEDIRAKAYLEKATKNRGGLAGKPAGWVIFDMDTGKSLGSRRYPTEAAADDAIPALLAAVAKRREAAQASTVSRQREEAANVSPHATRRYKTVNGGFGEGRVYDDQPGATQYDDGSGRFNVQIWDNA